MSSRSVPTTLIGPKGLLHDSLASLLGGFSYRVRVYIDYTMLADAEPIDVAVDPIDVVGSGREYSNVPRFCFRAGRRRTASSSTGRTART
jgi:hypothetical protein